MFNRLKLILALLVVAFIAIQYSPNGLLDKSSLAIAQSQSFTIGGRVTDGPANTGNGISGVSIQLVLNGTAQTPKLTDASGNFSFTGLAGGVAWSVTPSKANYTFQPTSRDGTNLGGNPTGETSNFFTGAQVTPTPTPTPTPGTNPLENAQFFVSQHYRDFLAREADSGGLSYWGDQISSCGDASCTRNRRVGVSAAFFVEQEFQRTGYVVYRMYRAAYGTVSNTPTRANITFAQFIADRALLPEGSDIAQTTTSYANAFVQRSEFMAAYPVNTHAQFVNKLFDTAGLTPYTTERQQQIDAMTNNGKTRAQVLLDVIEIAELKTREYNRSFVMMQYFGYLRRDPDQGGYDFWLGIVNTPSQASYRTMVCAFLTSREYQLRFSSHVPRNDSECANIN